MEYLIFLLSAVIPSIFGFDMGTCTFTRDCQQYRMCQNIQDAACVCKFGKCGISGGYWPGRLEPECKTYEDCECADDKEKCFCRYGQCVKQRWECHETSDCSRLKKCADGNCSCVGNLCEWECDTVSDCADSYCSRSLGYECE